MALLGADEVDCWGVLKRQRAGCGLVHDSAQQAIKGRMMRAVALLGADEVSLNA